MAGAAAAVDADVVVVGAGPAGTAAAIACAEANLRVVVCELRRFPRRRVGETLHPGVESVLARLGVLDAVGEAGFLRHEGVWLGSSGQPSFAPYGADDRGRWRGYQAWRPELDAILLERARSLGAAVMHPCRVLAPRMCGGRVGGVSTSRRELAARFVVDAAGPGHWLGRRLGLRVARRSPRLLARYGYALGSCPPRDAAPLFSSDPTGWTWTACVRPGVYQWTRLNLAGAPPPPGYRPAELRALCADERPAGADVSWRAVEPPAGPGYFAAGDAAAVIDPASSHGVLRALLSGLLAGELIAAVRRRELDEAVAARRYGAWIAGSFERDVRALGDLYRGLPQPPRWLSGGASRAA